MTQEENTFTSVLLPAARVTLFSVDEASQAAFDALAEDWRFARVEMSVEKGDVNAAISHYKNKASPDLVLIQTETIDDDFTDRLEDLAGNCSENTSAIVIGPVNDVNLYRQLVGMGVSDYLVKPVQTKSLGDDIAATLLEKIGASDSRLIALMGAKGGTGTTILAESLACSIAERTGQKTFLLDASGGCSTLSVGMDFEPSTTQAEAVRAAQEGNEDSLSRMMYQASDKLTILSSGGDVMLDDLVGAVDFEALLDMLMTKHPVVIVDLSSSSAALKRMIIKKAHQIFLVSTPALPAVRASRTLLQEIKQLRGDSEDHIEIIVNMQGATAKNEVPKAQIEEGLETKKITYIPFKPNLFMALESEARKITDTKDGNAVIDQLMTLVRGVGMSNNGEDGPASEADKKGSLGGILSKLTAGS